MASLPQDDTAAERAQRIVELDLKKAAYRFTQPPPLGVPQVAQLPPQERFDAGYNQAGTNRLFAIAQNALAVRARQTFDPHDHIQDFEDYFQTLPPPASVAHWRLDVYFAEQRLSGCNPIVLRRVKSSRDLPADNNITNADVQRSLGPGHTLVGLMRSGRLFVCDYAMLKDLPWGSAAPGPKRLWGPLALFYWRDPGPGTGPDGEFVPVAIQVRRAPWADKRVFTPHDADSKGWMAARMVLQQADATLHEVGTHLVRTHLVLEPFVIAAERNLSVRHPLLQLLRPHLRFILNINDDARNLLLNPGGRIEQLLGCTRAAAFDLAAEVYRDWSFWEDARLPAELATRGVDDPAKLPHYAYRDDGLLVYDAIHRFVTDFVDHYYANNAAVVGDGELQAFAQELRTSSKGKVKRLTPDRNRIRTKAHLIEVLTGVIWTSGPQHAAVNYTQWDMIGFAANVPLATYRDIPKVGDPPLSDHDLLHLLPPSGLTHTQLETMYYLGVYRYDRLGHYPAGTFDDDEADQIAHAFRSELAAIDAEIAQRNTQRRFRYEVLMPMLIPNSTSV